MIGHSQYQPFSKSFHRLLWTRFLGTTANQTLMVALAWQMVDCTRRAWWRRRKPTYPSPQPMPHGLQQKFFKRNTVASHEQCA